MKKYNHVLDFCFKVESPNADYATIPREILLKAMKDRIKRIEDSGEDIGVGHVETEEKP